MTTESLTVSIIVHDDFSQVERALESLCQGAHPEMAVYITINSGDADAIQRLRQKYPQFHYLINETPVGFAHNHNRVMRLAETPLVALLNDDIAFADGSLDRMVAFMNENPDVGLASPYVVNPDGTPQLTVFNDPTLPRMLYRISGLGHFTQHGGWVRCTLARLGLSRRLGIAPSDDRSRTITVPVVVGVAMFARRAAYEQAGLMDEATRVYGEEYGWHWRLRQSGWRIAVVGGAAVVHHNASQDLTDWKLAEHRKGILNYYVRYRPRWQAAVIRAAIVACHGVRAAATALPNPKQSRAEWQTVRMALTWNPTDAAC